MSLILMISPLQCSLATSTKDTSHLGVIGKPPRAKPISGHLMFRPRTLAARDPFIEISNITVQRLPRSASINSTSVDDLLPAPSRSHPTIYNRRVATVDRHDTDAWTQERKRHDMKLSAVATSSTLDFNGAVPGDYTLDVANSSLTAHPRRGLRTAQSGDTIMQYYGQTFPGTPSWDVSAVLPNATIHSYKSEDLSEGRRRVGEILIRCGVIGASGDSPVESTATGNHDGSRVRPGDALEAPHATTEISLDDDEVLIAALANWTSGWVYTLIIQPYLRGSFHFQYQEKPSSASVLVASRIRRVLRNVYNPLQVAIHTLWFIGALAGNDTHDHRSFLSIPILRYLHNNGTFIAEDFMFRTFVTCAMISDKTINDAALATTTWNRLTHIPQEILNATERYALRCLKWNVAMTQTEWQDTIAYLQSCIKMGSVFDPFAYDEASSSRIMARVLDELVNLSYADEAASRRSRLKIFAPQPIQHFASRGVCDTTGSEWRPEQDPVINQKPRTIGIAPGTNHHDRLNPLVLKTTAKKLLDSILGTSGVPFAHPAGVSVHGSTGAIRGHFAQSVKVARAYQGASWIPSHG